MDNEYAELEFIDEPIYMDFLGDKKQILNFKQSIIVFVKKQQKKLSSHLIFLLLVILVPIYFSNMNA